MHAQFPLAQSPLDLAHVYWVKLVQHGDTVVDATCGNGHDALRLARLVGLTGSVYAYDIQQQAIENATLLLSQHDLLDRVQLRHESHQTFHLPAPPRLIVYNLGYLPGSDKKIKTRSDSTLQSIANGMHILQAGGALSITAYPGHPEGAEEELALREFFKQLPPQEWSCIFHQWLNRQHAPSLFLLQRTNSD